MWAGPAGLPSLPGAPAYAAGCSPLPWEPTGITVSTPFPLHPLLQGLTRLPEGTPGFQSRRDSTCQGGRRSRWVQGAAGQGVSGGQEVKAGAGGRRPRQVLRRLPDPGAPQEATAFLLQGTSAPFPTVRTCSLEQKAGRGPRGRSGRGLWQGVGPQESRGAWGTVTPWLRALRVGTA